MWTGPVIFTLIISCLALLTALGSIGWQIYSWRRNGPKVEVSAHLGFVTGPGGQNFIAIEATNSGRLETMVQSFYFQLPEGRTLQPTGSYIKTTVLPARLSPGDQVSYYFNPNDIDQQLASAGLTRSDLQPAVRTGHGKVLGKKMPG
ncbi:hypothetical protein CH296_19725 [Rhodococcus sp. 14-2496-1d]|nr:hypothetical protein CH296_19725 [Rhodococcus sp. 14-2496-1d]